MISVRREIPSLVSAVAATTAVVRGLWCNLCGFRLVSEASPTNPAHSIQWMESEGNTSTWSLCVQCYRELLRCAACGTPVGNEAILLEDETHIYCRYCFEQRPRCDTCGRPVGAHYWNRADGRKLCDRCQSTAVSDPGEAHLYYKRVRADLSRRLGMSLRDSCQLKLVSRNQLLHLIDKSSLHHLDAASRERCFGLFVRESGHKAIFLEYGLPRIVLLEVMAHEYAHAWQSENCQREASSEVVEGFAEWVAYKLLEAWGCHRRSTRMLRRDDVYGCGLRLMLSWEKEGGPTEVFRRVMNERL